MSSQVFLIGIGGIGMSALAQLLVWRGYSVAGSDRGLHDPSKHALYESLAKQGIRLYPQDGSGVLAEKPERLIISTAVEEGNPDLTTGHPCTITHRAAALADELAAIQGARLITVAGSCGKTSVTGWLATALHALGEPTLMVNGGYCLDCENDRLPGNFSADPNPRWLVAEVDESDHSISQFAPDYGILLNVGTDHYEQEELRRVFAAYLQRCRHGAVVADDLAPLAAEAKAPVRLFSTVPAGYHAATDGIRFQMEGVGEVHARQPGQYSAVNAMAVLTQLLQLNLPVDGQRLAAAITAFSGVRQRFEIMGKTAKGMVLINDYAHNPDKISACIQAAHEQFGAPLTAIFQPHGFRPLQFMKDALADSLQAALQPGDQVLLLPVYYAGGSAAFSPTSEEVAAEYRAKGLPVHAVSTRQDVEDILKSNPMGCALVMGARDYSLRLWTKNLVNL